MSKILAAQRRNILKSDGFFPHKANKKGNTVIWSRSHPTAKFVRVVVNSGVDAKSGNITGNAGVKLCYINRAKGWREITTEIFTNAKGLASVIKAQEKAEKFVKSCKFCKAKKFKAKTGNIVCANACWTAWSGKKKSEKTTKKTSQPTAQKKAVATYKKKSQKVTPKSQRTYPLNKSFQRKGQKNLQRFTQEILPGDLVTIEKCEGHKVLTDYTGSVLGIVQKVEGQRVTTVWSANSSGVPNWMLPQLNEDTHDALARYRLKVLSRKAEWVKVA